MVIPVSLLNTKPTRETVKIVIQDGNNTVKDLATLDGTPSGSLISSLPLFTRWQYNSVAHNAVINPTNNPLASVKLADNTLAISWSPPSAASQSNVTEVKHREIYEPSATGARAKSLIP